MDPQSPIRPLEQILDRVGRIGWNGHGLRVDRVAHRSRGYREGPSLGGIYVRVVFRFLSHARRE